MKKSLTLIFLLASISFANSDYIENFYKNGGKRTPDLEKLITVDKNLNNAISYLEDQSKMITMDVDFTDPEIKNAPKNIKKQTLPDYINSLKEFKKSFDKYKNPISAYDGIYLIKTIFGKNKEIEYFNKFSKALYETQKDICISYIDYGEVLQNGFFQKKDLLKALEVYKEGLANKSCNGWQKNILAGKIDLLEMAKK
jgi:hypothetical protein